MQIKCDYSRFRDLKFLINKPTSLIHRITLTFSMSVRINNFHVKLWLSIYSLKDNSVSVRNIDVILTVATLRQLNLAFTGISETSKRHTF